jgi:hypothetical protein
MNLVVVVVVVVVVAVVIIISSRLALCLKAKTKLLHLSC